MDWIHVDRIGPLTDNRNTYVDNFTGEKTQHGSCLKECQWYQQVQNFKLCPYKGVCSWGSLVTVEMVCFHTYIYGHVVSFPDQYDAMFALNRSTISLVFEFQFVVYIIRFC